MLPDYVRQEFDEYLKCGRLEHGFLRVQCNTCHLNIYPDMLNSAWFLLISLYILISEVMSISRILVKRQLNLLAL